MERIPKVFISYSWSSPEHMEKVRLLAEKLIGHSIDVVLDQWELKEGQDKYVFMEQCVVSPDIDRVLIILDKKYAEKADNRQGGVGDETTVISPKIYSSANQKKFIPIIFECDENGEPYRPAYLQSRMYINLADESIYQEQYEQLVRNIFDKPLFRKPGIGKPPDFILEETSNYAPLRDIVRQIMGTTDMRKGKLDVLIRRFVDEFNTKMDEHRIGDRPENKAELVMAKIGEMKNLRDIYLDFLEALIVSGAPISATFFGFFESIINNVYAETKSSWADIEYDHFLFLIWDMFICTTACLLHYEKYSDIRDLVEHTYFLKSQPHSEEKPKSFTAFRPYLQSLENIIKRSHEEPRLFSLTADIAVKRERLPVISKKTIVEADVLLCQLSWIWAADTSKNSDTWFPMTYVYDERGQASQMWRKLVSRKYCQTTGPMYGASSIDELKEIAQRGHYTREIKHPGAWNTAPSIASTIEIAEIGSRA